MKLLIISIIFLLVLSNCVTVKHYEKQFINDPEMQMGNDAGMNFINYVHSIREGSTSAGNTKGNGGCGCN